MELPALTNQVTVNYNGYQTHGLHRSLMWRDREKYSLIQSSPSTTWPEVFPDIFHTDLPLSDVLHPLSERSLQAGAELQGVTADLDDVVDKSTHGRQGKRGGEEHHIAELNEHFLVVLERVLSRVKRNETT